MAHPSAGEGILDDHGVSAIPIASRGVTLALVLRAGPMPKGTQFVTPPDATLQVGVLGHAEGTTIPRHVHRDVERHVSGTSEVLIVRSGSCEVDVYDEHELIATEQLRPGDVIVLLAGGHGLRMLEDTVLVEVKQGPYLGVEDKVRY
jgi:mannose-6-phosphate isomerase-like protein (cupin superfamily)